MLIPLKKGNIVLSPRVSESAFVAPSAIIAGDVRIGELSSIWYNAVVRADFNWIEIGKGTNIQDDVVIHVDTMFYPTFIGNFVTVGHRATIHGSLIKDFSLIGIGAIVMNGAEVGPFSIVGAGALVTENSKIPPGTLAVGVPARVKRELTDREIDILKSYAQSYIELSRLYLKSCEQHEISCRQPWSSK